MKRLSAIDVLIMNNWLVYEKSKRPNL